MAEPPKLVWDNVLAWRLPAELGVAVRQANPHKGDVAHSLLRTTRSGSPGCQIVMSK